MKKILFLGYNERETRLINRIKTHNSTWKIKQTEKKIILKEIQDVSVIICFGYRNIINNEIISNFKRPIINLHLSYLPFNRGAHPNFWSFIDNTPSGVSIYRVKKGIDTGEIIYQKKINFNKKKNTLTFASTYSSLFTEIENLFIKNIDGLINNKLKSYPQTKNSTYHNKKDLPNLLKNWDQNIYETVLEYNRLYKKNEK